MSGLCDETIDMMYYSDSCPSTSDYYGGGAEAGWYAGGPLCFRDYSDDNWGVRDEYDDYYGVISTDTDYANDDVHARQHLLEMYRAIKNSATALFSRRLEITIENVHRIAFIKAYTLTAGQIALVEQLYEQFICLEQSELWGSRVRRMMQEISLLANNQQHFVIDVDAKIRAYWDKEQAPYHITPRQREVLESIYQLFTDVKCSEYCTKLLQQTDMSDEEQKVLTAYKEATVHNFEQQRTIIALYKSKMVG